jgi:hypothetical protein
MNLCRIGGAVGDWGVCEGASAFVFAVLKQMSCEGMAQRMKRERHRRQKGLREQGFLIWGRSSKLNAAIFRARDK